MSRCILVGVLPPHLALCSSGANLGAEGSGVDVSDAGHGAALLMSPANSGLLVRVCGGACVTVTPLKI